MQEIQDLAVGSDLQTCTFIVGCFLSIEIFFIFCVSNPVSLETKACRFPFLT